MFCSRVEEIKKVKILRKILGAVENKRIGSFNSGKTRICTKLRQRKIVGTIRRVNCSSLVTLWEWTKAESQSKFSTAFIKVWKVPRDEWGGVTEDITGQNDTYKNDIILKKVFDKEESSREVALGRKKGGQEWDQKFNAYKFFYGNLKEEEEIYAL